MVRGHSTFVKTDVQEEGELMAKVVLFTCQLRKVYATILM